MSRDFDCIKDLKKDLDVWKICFRVLDSWIVTASNGNQDMELIIGDAKVFSRMEKHRFLLQTSHSQAMIFKNSRHQEGSGQMKFLILSMTLDSPQGILLKLVLMILKYMELMATYLNNS